MELSKTEFGIVAVHTVSKMFEGYTKQEAEKSKLARELQGMVGNPTDFKYKDMVSDKILPNFPIITHDITNANSMFVTDLSSVRGKIVRKNPSKLDTEEFVKILEYFYKLHKFFGEISVFST